MPFASNVRIAVIRDVTFQHTGKDSLQRVIILLRDRVKLVRVTTSAVSSGAGERRHRLSYQIVTIKITERDRCGAEGTQVERTGTQESQRRSQPGFVWREDICRQLITDESRPRYVAVECINDVIPKWPGVVAANVVFVAMRIGKVDRVQPVSSPTFAVAWRSQQPIDSFFICERVQIIHKCIGLLGCGSQARQIVVDAADQCSSISCG